jgi:enoyl-CoA hydratase/carnithine racemase
MANEAENNTVLSERRGHVQWLIINRPERKNALNESVVAALIAGVSAAMEDLSVKAIVITAAGDGAFCAGADLNRTAEGTPFGLSPADPSHFIVELFKTLERCRVPVIARINGHALAGGFGLACACDIAIAAEEATLGTTEVAIGLFPMMILPYLLRTGPHRKVLEMCITGMRISAKEALELNLLNYVVPRHELDEKVDWLLSRILDKSPTAIRLGKMGFHALRDMTLDQAFEYGQLMLRIMAQSDDAKEGMQAFINKKKPEWTGR